MAATERMVDKVMRITQNPKNIRNICTSAHIHHGKCVGPTTRLMLTTGEAITAEKLFSQAEKIGLKVRDDEQETVFDVSGQNMEVFSLNKETGKLEKKKVSHAWRLVGGRTITISLQNGFKATTTPEHKYIIFAGSFREVDAEGLTPGDLVVCAANIDFFWDSAGTEKESYRDIELPTTSGRQRQLQLLKKPYCDLAFVKIVSITETFEPIVYDFSVPDHKNFIAEGMVIHNTAFTDNLLAAAGMMSEKAAGDLEAGMATWQHADEQERLMTVDAANVSMVHDFQGSEYLINLIDTPGHVDFGGNVTRAMRAVDGTVVLICGVEGIMPQTETVVRQAVRERVKPVLFINKVDRLVKELKFTPEQISQRITLLVTKFNQLIEDIAEPQYRQIWKVSVQEGSVAFGSARENWALSFSYMQKRDIKFADILKIYQMEEEERKKWVWENSPLHEVILDMVIKHLPDPLTAQKYRLPRMWHGDLESTFGQDLMNCNPVGKLAFVITRIVIDPRSGKDISAGRLFSGTIKSGMEVWLNMAKQKQKIQNVYIYNGIKPELIESLPAGNVLAISGVVGFAGETVTSEPEEAFEELKHIFEPVITKAIEPKKPGDLPKLIEVLRKVGREDPSIKIEINEETGQNLMSGMGELHLEIIENRIITEKGVEVKTSAPIVVYRETITKPSPEVEGKSPNKHNKLYFKVQPLNPQIAEGIKAGTIPAGRFRKKNEEMIAFLREEVGWDAKRANMVKAVKNGNMFLDETRGIVYINEILEMVIDMFDEVMKAGPLAKEPCINVMVSLTDCSLHEDAIHRGPAQMYPAVREGIRGAMMQAGPVMYEPLQVMRIEVPHEYLGEITKLVSSKRGQILDLGQEGNMSIVKAKLPVGEMLGWSSDLRSATEGRGSSSLVDQMFERLPYELQEKVRSQIIKRKGLTAGELGA